PRRSSCRRSSRRAPTQESSRAASAASRRATRCTTTSPRCSACGWGRSGHAGFETRRCASLLNQLRCGHEVVEERRSRVSKPPPPKKCEDGRVSPRDVDPPGDAYVDDSDDEALHWAGDDARGQAAPRLRDAGAASESDSAAPEELPEADVPRSPAERALLAGTVVFGLVYLALSI